MGSSSNATFASQQATNGIASYLSKTKAQGRNNHKIVSQAYLQPGFCDPNMPLVAFGSTSSASTAVAQNALKSTCNQSLLPNQSLVNGNNAMPYPMMMTMTSNESLPSSRNDQAGIHFQPQNHNSNVVPTLTLAAMQITDQHQHQQQYTSIFGPSPR
jgi:hypothetical protein